MDLNKITFAKENSYEAVQLKTQWLTLEHNNNKNLKGEIQSKIESILKKEYIFSYRTVQK